MHALNRLVKFLVANLVNQSLWQVVPEHLQHLKAYGSSVKHCQQNDLLKLPSNVW